MSTKTPGWLSDLTAKEPVMAGTAALWLMGNAGVLLVSRYHLVTDGQWKVASLEITPLVTALVLAVLGLLVRSVVTPLAKLGSDEFAKLGLSARPEPVPALPSTPDPAVADLEPIAEPDIPQAPTEPDPIAAALADPAPADAQ